MPRILLWTGTTDRKAEPYRLMQLYLLNQCWGWNGVMKIFTLNRTKFFHILTYAGLTHDQFRWVHGQFSQLSDTSRAIFHQDDWFNFISTWLSSRWEGIDFRSVLWQDSVNGFIFVRVFLSPTYQVYSKELIARTRFNYWEFILFWIILYHPVKLCIWYSAIHVFKNCLLFHFFIIMKENGKL